MVHFVAVSTDESVGPSSTQGKWLDVSGISAIQKKKFKLLYP